MAIAGVLADGGGAGSVALGRRRRFVPARQKSSSGVTTRSQCRGPSAARRASARTGPGRRAAPAQAAAKASASPGATVRRGRRPRPVAERVAARGDHREPGPQVVEHAGAVGEARLEVVVVGGHAEVGLQQPRAALLVGHPAGLKCTRVPLQPERASARASAAASAACSSRSVQRRAARRPWKTRSRRRRARAGRAARIAVGASSQSQIAAAPQQHAVVRADPRGPRSTGGPRRRGGSAGQAERHDVEPAQLGRPPSGRVAARASHAEPQVALASRWRRSTKSAAAQMRGRGAATIRARPRAGPRATVRRRLERLDRRSGCRGRRRAGSAAAPHPREHPRRQLLGDDDVVLARRRPAARRSRRVRPRAACSRVVGRASLPRARRA